MKFILSVAFLLFSLQTYADDSAHIKSLEDRIRALEAQNGSTSDSGGLKVKDLGGKEINSNRAPTSSAPAMSAGQQAEMMKKIGDFKIRREEEMKLLDQMENEEGY